MNKAYLTVGLSCADVTLGRVARSAFWDALKMPGALARPQSACGIGRGKCDGHELHDVARLI